MEIDTGSAVSLLSEQQWCSLFPKIKLQQYTGKPLRSYTGDAIEVKGETTAEVEYNSVKYKMPLVVVSGSYRPALIGRDWLAHIRLDWIMVSQIKQEGDSPDDDLWDVFRPGVGTVKGFTANIELKDGANPVFCKARPVAYALRDKVGHELDRMVGEGSWQPVKYSKWASAIVVVPKPNGSIRICGDYKATVNPQIKSHSHPIPCIEDILAGLSGNKIFTKLDLSQAYQQLELEEASKEVLTINTHKGLFRPTRLPYGVSTAPAQFQCVMEQVLNGLPVSIYLDDVLIGSKTKVEHEQMVDQVMKRLEEHGVRLKKEKCEFSKTELVYLGHKINGTGILPTDEKVRAINDVKIPKDIQELRSFIGMVNFYGKFIPNMSTLLAPLYSLLSDEEKESENWGWNETCTDAFNECKRLLTSKAILVHYDQHVPIKLSCDASSYGVGAVLSHVVDSGERPVAYASRTLSSAEVNYSQVEKEALGLIFGVKKFHKYLYGRTFTLVTDHKSLLALLGPKSDIPTLAAARMQRWALTLAAYDYQVEFRAGREHGNADMLSRLPVDQVKSVEVDVPEINSMIGNLPVCADEIARETRVDRVLTKVMLCVMEGWPKVCQDVDLQKYHQVREYLSVDQGCLVFGFRVVIPESLRDRMLEELHETHCGVVKMKAVARSFVWWPGLDKDVESWVRNCDACASYKDSPPSAPLRPWPWAERPMQRVHVDFGDFQGTQLLVMVDVHSKWIEAVQMHSTTTSATVNVLRRFMASFGVIEELVSDNGPQFTSKEFAMFCRQNGIRHTLVAPYHGASNGAAERAVGVVKTSLSKMKGYRMSVALANILMRYRMTPHATTGMRPDELFLKRQIRSRLSLVRPSLRGTVEKSQAVQKYHHDNSKPLMSFTLGERVFVKDGRGGDPKWMEGRIVSVKGTHTYLVRVNGRIRYCHVEHLQKANQNEEHLQTANQSPCLDGTRLPQPAAALPIRPATQTTSAVPNTENTMVDYAISPSPRVESLPLRQSSRTTHEPKRFSDQDWSM